MLDTSEVRSVKAQGVRVTIRVCLAAVVMLSVAAILVSPSLSDDIDGILHQHHLRVVHSFFVSASLLHDLLVAWEISVAGANPRMPHLAELVDLFCCRLC